MEEVKECVAEAGYEGNGDTYVAFEFLITTIEAQKEEIEELREREYNHYPVIILDLETRIFRLQDLEELKIRHVPDMTELSDEDYRQFKDLWIIHGTGYLFTVLRHLDFLAKIPDYFSPERYSPNTTRGL